MISGIILARTTIGQSCWFLCTVFLAVFCSTWAAPLAATATIDNPCGLPPNPNIEVSIVDVLKSAITAANAAGQVNKDFVAKIRADGMLTSNEINTYTNKTLPNLPLRLPEMNISKANELTRNLRVCQFNVKLLYMANEMLLKASLFPSEYVPSIDIISQKMITISCLISKMAKKLQGEFSQSEMNVDRELQFSENTAFGTAATELQNNTFKGIESFDMKTAFVNEFIVANGVITEMRSLVQILDAEMTNRGASA